MTFGFREGSIPPGQTREGIHMCLIIAPVIESMMYAVPLNSKIAWEHPQTNKTLAFNLAEQLMADEGYSTHGGDISKR